MTKIAHYEVYVENGSDWQLIERFATEQRHEAYQLAKEYENSKKNVKIIKETYEIEDNNYIETVEYISSRNSKKATKKSLSNIDYQRSSADVIQDIVESRRNIYKAIFKFFALILVSLIFANIFVSLIFPLLEIFVDDDNKYSLVFFVFFIVFLAMAIPLLLKNIPWYIFINKNDRVQADISEETFFTNAQNLVKAYNINSNIENLKTSSYPEAPLEYKQYLIYFLSEILSGLNTKDVMQNKFFKFGIKLFIFGGCLELGRYGGLKLNEANSILYDALKVIDGDKADLEKFYEAKQSYSDNKIAIYLVGVGAYLMHQIIFDQNLNTLVLNKAFSQWIDQKDPQVNTKEENHSPEPSSEEGMVTDVENNMSCRVNIKSDLKFLDSAVANQEEVATSISQNIRTIISNLVSKYEGSNVIEFGGVTSVDFQKVRNGAKFAVEYLKDIGSVADENNGESLILRNCCLFSKVETSTEPNLSRFVVDVFEHIYNNEIATIKDFVSLFEGEGYEVEYLGDKKLKETGGEIELFKVKY